MKLIVLFGSIKHCILIVDCYVMYTDVCEYYSHALGEQLALGYIYLCVLACYREEHVLLLTALAQNNCYNVVLLWVMNYKYECYNNFWMTHDRFIYENILPEHIISSLFRSALEPFIRFPHQTLVT